MSDTQPCGTARATYISLGVQATGRGASSSSLNGINQGWGRPPVCYLISSRHLYPPQDPHRVKERDTRVVRAQISNPNLVEVGQKGTNTCGHWPSPGPAVSPVPGCHKQYVKDCPTLWEMAPLGGKAGQGKQAVRTLPVGDEPPGNPCRQPGPCAPRGSYGPAR